jgi:glycosyltransferase involved in cell wall biosynthesis
MVVNSDPVRDGRVRKEAQSLVAAGHAVTVFAVRASQDRSGDAALGFPVVFPAMPKWIEAGGALNTMRKTARWFERMRPLADAAIASEPDVVHAHDLDTVGPASRAAHAAGIPCVYDDHEASYVDKLPNYAPAAMRGPKRAVLDALTRRLQRRGEALEREVRARGLAAMITVSDALADRLVARFGGPRPVVVRNCPALRDVPRTDALREKIGAPREAKLLLYHGTATEGSGVEVVIRALRHLPPNYLFALVGRVWRQDKYEALARAEGIADRVRFVPFVAEDEMFRLVASADVGLVPTEPNSEGNTYGLANKFFESMMAGLPLVASATPAVKPILERTKAGLLYPAEMPQDPAALAAAARRLCEDRALWASCREAALRAARDEFNWERESAGLVATYERLASGPRRTNRD